MAMRILDLIAGWRPLPTITLLLRDDPDRCLRQFQQRIDRSASSDERQLMARASDLYLQMAAAAPGGVTVIDRTGLSVHGIAWIEIDDAEADDVIATLVATADPCREDLIVSIDQDDPAEVITRLGLWHRVTPAAPAIAARSRI